ncbi:MAG TPA: hypothetical protein VFC42_09160 [Methylomirabilota bacterium]|jgi:hypothetical protein|nr:hypothetical protein [Methylomirabilota bacterium]
MDSALLIGLIALVTTLGAIVLGARADARGRGRLAAAARRTAHAMGMAAIFLAANVVVGLVAVAVLPGLLSRFVSRYPLGDVSLVGVSLLQGVMVAAWREAGGDP